ncbi:fatty acid synthase alpha subunit Lsd1 [Coemansia sp. RSA 1086]|nr:fatty acid synthase alpha subunit Lsd1 [Coemansia sp. RSA 1086]
MESSVTLACGPSTISVPAPLEQAARDLIAEFTAASATLDELAKIVVHSQFIEFCVARNVEVAKAAFDSFNALYCSGTQNIHVAVEKHQLGLENTREVLAGYFAGWALAPPLGISKITENSAKLGVFGGAYGCSSGVQCLTLLQTIFAAFQPLLSNYFALMAEFLDNESRDEYIAHLYPYGLNVIKWIEQNDTVPPADYIDSSPVALPLLGLAQLARVLVLAKSCGLDVAQLAVAGHSHGLIIAAAVASASNENLFVASSKKALGWLMLIGGLPLIVSPQAPLHPLAVADSLPHEGRPSPMAVVQGALREVVDIVLKKYNKFVGDNDSAHVHLSIIEATDQFVISGNLSSITQVIMNVRKKAAVQDEDQSEVPFLKRKPQVTARYIDTNAPFHSTHMSAVAQRHLAYVESKGWMFDSQDMHVPLQTADKLDLRDADDLTRALVERIYLQAVNWPKTLLARKDITHIVDFAPVSQPADAAIGNLRDRTCRTIDGHGIALVCPDMVSEQASVSPAVRPLSHLFADPESPVVSWQDKYSPALVKTRADGAMRVDNRLQRIIGLPPIVVAGQAPTTAHPEFIAAASRAGFLAELNVDQAASEMELVSLVTDTAAQIQPGHGIVLNCTWSAQQKWLPAAVKTMVQDHYLPVIGLTLDDKPSLELCAEFSTLHALGLRFIALKPQTKEQIYTVLDIADKVDPLSIVLQWFGGRTGGAHSFEEFHLPIMQTYGRIRQHDNVVLVAGSGFGDGEGVLPYIDGSWGQFFDAPFMPFDGVLLRSRVVISKESNADEHVKSLIAQASSLDPFDLAGLFEYSSETGSKPSVISVLDHNKRHLHVVSNRAARMCKDLGDILSQPADKQPKMLQARKAEVIYRLNSDFMRPWFGKKADGQAADLEDMTYMEIIDRLVSLMYVARQRRWIHPSYRNFVAKFAERAAMRLYSKGTKFEQPHPPVHYDPVLDEIETIRHCYREDIHTQLVASEDVQFFLSLCLRPLQKPVPFVPVLDKNFAFYLMSDAFGQMEDLEAVNGEDGEDAAQRVLIPQGLVSVGYSNEINEPLSSILDGVNQGIVQGLLASQYKNDSDLVPQVAYLGPDPMPAELPSVVVSTSNVVSERTYKFQHSEALLPSTGDWIRVLAGPRKCWLHALLMAEKIVQGARTVANYLPHVLRPRAGRMVKVLASGESEEPSSVEIYCGQQRELDLVIAEGSRITLSIYHSNTTLERAVQLEYAYRPDTSLLPIHEVMDGRDERIRQFFVDMWLQGQEHTEDEEESLEFTTRQIEITSEKISEYCRATGISLPAYPPSSDQATSVPMDYLPILTLPSAFKALTSKRVHSNLLHMVQTTNHIEHVKGVQPLRIGDCVDSCARVVEVSKCPRGKKVVISSQVQRQNEVVGKVLCTFVFLGAVASSAECFRCVEEEPIVLQLNTDTDADALESKDWFQYLGSAAEPKEPQVRVKRGDRLQFNLQSEYTLRDDGSFSSVRTTGTVYTLRLVHDHRFVATVDFADSACVGNPVTAFLQSRGEETAPQASMFEDGGYALAQNLQTRAPQTAHAYALASNDHNPHNTNPYVADLTSLPGPLMQGLWTSAAVRHLIERHVAQGDPTRVREFSVEFSGMVQPETRLETQLYHVGMHRGQMLVRGQTYNVDTGELVVTCSAKVAQPRTVYVFTGQGSQEPGMCMDLYERSPAARDVCDRADAHMRERFGFSILDIIRHNPKQYTVHFGGTRGAQVRKNYMLFTRRVDTPEGPKTVPLFPEITPTARSYTFHSPTGLLNATQFAQPAIMLFDVAVTSEMRARGVFVEDALLAGHSLGEYGALAAFKMMTLEDIIDITFIRGMTMQSTVERDAQHNSAFAMVAVNPSRVGRIFDEQALDTVITQIREAQNGELLEIVNYNVRQFQYVVAGTRAQLAILGHILDIVHARQINVNSRMGRDAVQKLVDDAVSQGGCGTTVRRTRATIPIPGIDVPFHSSHLLAGASQFRSCINMMVRETSTDCASYIGRYIPNLTAATFDVSREYFELVYNQTKSLVIAQELENWPEPLTAREKTRLARLMVIELLSYQFASPVRWIETQDKLLHEFAVEQIIEVGPNATLCRMAEGSLMISGLEKQVAVKHIFRDEDDIYYTNAMIAAKEAAAAERERQEAISTPAVVEATNRPAQVASEPAKPVPAAAAPALQPAVTSASPNVPLQAVDVVRVVIAQKTKRSLIDIPASKSVKELTGGKSTLQNEILGDLLKEFGAGGQIPDRPDEISLSELSAKFGSAFKGALGSYTSSQVSRMFSTKMPGSFSQSTARSWLRSQHGLEHLHMQDMVLLLALTMEPSSRLGSKEDAQSWVSDVARKYAEAYEVTLAQPQSQGAAGGDNPGAATVSSEVLDAVQKGHRDLAHKQLELYARYLGIDLRQAHRSHEAAQDESKQQQEQIDAITQELGSDFVAGIHGVFSKQKARIFNSFWNWAREDAFAWISNTLVSSDEAVEWTREDEERLLMLANRADLQLLKLVDGMKQLLLKTPDDPHVAGALKLIARIRDACTDALDRGEPVYCELAQPTQPVTTIGTAGKVEYHEIPRESSFSQYVDSISSHDAAPHPPLVHLREKTPSHDYVFSKEHSEAFYAGLRQMCSNGLSFAGYTALVTGCSRGSIAAQAIQGLLAGGARVIATTSSYKHSTMLFYESLYKKYGAKGSELIVVPFNQGSVEDVTRIVEYIYGDSEGSQGLASNVDFVLPFAAISEYGSDISGLGSRAELATRIMLTNVLRLLGEIKRVKQQQGIDAQPTMAVLPLSPNHGVFGYDGMYGETKAALETVFNRWLSEGWGSYVSVAGAKIGWTRGTGLMAVNNTIAQQIEAHGTRTFSTAEMAFNILGLLHPDVVDIAQHVPIWADLNGGLQRIQNVNEAVNNARAHVQQESGRRQAVVMSYGTDFVTSAGQAAAQMHTDYKIEPLFNHQQRFAPQRSYEKLEHLHHLQGMANLEKVVVVTGYGEIGPYGHAETRWEMEATGEFSLEGCVELAWIMGLVKHHNGPLAAHDNKHYTGWVDAKTNEPVKDVQIKQLYEEQILDHSGIRLLEPELLEDQDPAVVPIMRELQIEHDMEPFETTADEASAFKLRNGDKVDVWENEDSSWSVRFLKGAVLMVPKALRFDRLVGGQLPTGWDPVRYGIPKDVVDQVDMVTCYALVATVEALIRSGITDPYELYSYFHVSQVGTSVGSGAGGVHSIKDLYRNRLTDKPVQSDILQETFVNTTPAWINMLLLSSAGAIKPPTGGCGTSVLSVDVAADTIRAGKARMMLAGGFEGFVDQGSYEFAQMGATSDSVTETNCGRTPREMSRPTTSTRTGFVEAQGAGIVVLMSAAAAIEYGAPIYGIIAYSGTATDKQSQSLPAPGMGVLTSACELSTANPSHLRIMDINYRRRQITRSLKEAEAWAADERIEVEQEAGEIADETERAAFTALQMQMIEDKLVAKKAEALDTWGTEFWQHTQHVSPLRGSLAAWGLSADDIGAASFHGTATMANDLNESHVLNEQLQHIGRTPGHAVPAICQKWLTGHPKGPAAAWMLNGALQCIRDGIVPGNRNADNIDNDLQKFEYIVYPSKSIRTRQIKAVLLKSFGFGQVGAEILVVHPDYLLATLSREELEKYNQRLAQREKSAYRYWQDTFAANHQFVQLKSVPPFTPDQEKTVYLDPSARTRLDASTGNYRF